MVNKIACLMMCIIVAVGMLSCGRIEMNTTPDKGETTESADPNADPESPDPESAGPGNSSAASNDTGNTETVSLGVTTFSIDETNKATVDFTPGEDASLELTDGSGLTWRLAIPGDALMSNETITMTALSAVKNDRLGSLTGGVQFEPDGLNFISPAVLEVSGEKIEKNSIILISKHDGSSTKITDFSAGDSGLSATIFHFTDAYEGDSSVKDELQQYALDDLSEIENDIQRLLASPIEPPEPPSISLVCRDGSDFSQNGLYQYTQSFLEPEKGMLQRYRDAIKSYMVAFGKKYEPNDKDVNQLKYELVNRWNKKMKMLMDTYAPLPAPEKFTALYRTYQAYTEYLHLADTDTFKTDKTPFHKDFIAWAGSIFDKYVADVREKHDYPTLSGALEVIRYLKQLQVEDLSKYKTAIKDVLTFKVTFESNVDLAGSAVFYLKGEAEVSFPDDQTLNDFIFNEEPGVFIGKGTGNYNSFDSSEPSVSLKLPNSFAFSAVVTDYRPCKSGVINLHIDKFGADSEVFVVDGNAAGARGTVNPTTKLLLKDYMAIGELMKYGLGNTFYKFQTELNIGDETAARKSISESLNEINITYKINLIHAPK